VAVNHDSVIMINYVADGMYLSILEHIYLYLFIFYCQ